MKYKGFTYTPAPKTAWDNLSMLEKSEMMKVAIRNGITDLNTIREKYNEFAGGGGIHIKPENRGKFTALKERTGHSATWFKEHGTPAQKKMATFALNARHWKHGLGGNLFDGTSEPTQQMNVMAYHPVEDYFTGPSATMPEINVTRKGDGKTYVGLGDFSKRYDRQKERPYFVSSRTGQLTAGDAMKGIDAATGPLLHWMQPSQYVGAVRDAVKGKNPLTSMLRGNSGVVSEEYAQEHPWLSTVFNLGTDAAILGSLSRVPIGKVKGIVGKSQKASAKEEPDLVWDAEQMFKDGKNRSYTQEDVDILNSFIPEYREIEKASKANGTYLKMSDGSIWRGDPREWVIAQSKNVKANYGDDILTHGDSDAWINNAGVDVSGDVLGEKVLWTSTNPFLGGTYGNKVYRFVIPKNADIKTVADAQGRYWRDVLATSPGTDTNHLVYPNLTDNNVVRIKNVVDRGSNNFFRNELPQPLPNEDFNTYHKRVFIGDDLVLGKKVRRKALLGNNGEFDITNPNIFKGLIPVGLGSSTYLFNLNNTDNDYNR